MTLKKAIETLKDYRKGNYVGYTNICEAIDTVVKALEKPTYTAEDMEAFAEWIDNHHTVQLKTGKQLREIWLKGQSTEEVVKVIATYEFMRGTEEIKYKNKGES